jgi:hypothetical protein
MKTTIEIADPLLRKAKQRAARDGTTLRALVETGLKTVLSEPIEAGRTYDWKIKPFRGNGLTKDFKEADWSKIRNASYGLLDDE